MKTMNWGGGIVLVIVLFFAAMGVMLSIAMMHRSDLVAENYYERELNYQDRLNSMNRAVNVPHALTASVINDTLTIRIAPEAVSKEMSGTIHFYRPSDKQMDLEVPMHLDTLRSQRIPTARMAPGLWKIQAAWKGEGGEYFTEQPVIIQ